MLNKINFWKSEKLKSKKQSDEIISKNNCTSIENFLKVYKYTNKILFITYYRKMGARIILNL